MRDRGVKTIGKGTAAQRRLELRRFCCSEFWVDAIVAPVCGGRWELRLDLYETYKELMQVCPVCSRRCPPYGPEGSPCCDCDVQKSEKSLYERKEKLVREWAEDADASEHRSLAQELYRRWWRSPISCADFMAAPMAALAGHGELAHAVELLGSPVQANMMSEFAEAYADSALYFDDETPPKRGSESLYIAVETAMYRLRSAEVPTDVCPKCDLLLRESEKASGACSECGACLRGRKKIDRMHPGCELELLQETESGLLDEIKRFEKRWRGMSENARLHDPYLAVVRSAKRLYSLFEDTPQLEDFLPGTAYLGPGVLGSEWVETNW